MSYDGYGRLQTKHVPEQQVDPNNSASTDHTTWDYNNDDTITFPRSNRGAYTFSSLANFLAGAYNNSGFTQTFGATLVSQRNPNVGLYVQDEWKVAPGVTLNAGLRYDLQFLQTITTDTNKPSAAPLPFVTRLATVSTNRVGVVGGIQLE